MTDTQHEALMILLQSIAKSTLSIPMLAAAVAIGLAVYFYAPALWTKLKSLIPKRAPKVEPVETDRAKQQRAKNCLLDAAELCATMPGRQKFAEPLRKIAGGVVYPPSVTVRKRGQVQ